MTNQRVRLTCLHVEQQDVSEGEGTFREFLLVDGHEETARVAVGRDIDLGSSLRDGRRDACLDVVERVVAAVAIARLTVVGLKDLVYVLVLLFWNFLVDGHKEVLHVIGQPSVSLASIFADECLLARLGVNRFVASCALCLAIAAEVTVAFGKPPLEAIETELLTRREVDEDVLAFRFAAFVSNVFVDADILA